MRVEQLRDTLNGIIKDGGAQLPVVATNLADSMDKRIGKLTYSDVEGVILPDYINEKPTECELVIKTVEVVKQ